MNRLAIRQTAVYIGIAIIVYFFVQWIAPSHPFQPKGIILPMVKTVLVPSHAPVQVFQNAMPYAAKPLAYIHLEGHSLKPNKAQEQKMLVRAIKMTQEAGGNGLVIHAFGYEGQGLNNPTPLAKYVLFGKAVQLN